MAEDFRKIVHRLGHDLRGPLLNVRMGLEVVLSESDPETRQAIGEQLGAELNRLDNLVEGMLEYVRANHCQLSPVRPSTLLYQLFNDVPIPENIHLVQEIEDVEPMQLDPELQLKVFKHLLRNALQAARSQVRVHLYRLNHALRISFEDDGPGLAAADLEAVFAPTVGKWRQGLGLGLTFARQTVEAQGGRIWLEPSPLGGLAAVLEFPEAD